MRKDAKVGMTISLVVVVLAGWYFTRDSDMEDAIPLTDREPPAYRIETDETRRNIDVTARRVPLGFTDAGGELAIGNNPTQTEVVPDDVREGRDPNRTNETLPLLTGRRDNWVETDPPESDFHIPPVATLDLAEPAETVKSHGRNAANLSHKSSRPAADRVADDTHWKTKPVSQPSRHLDETAIEFHTVRRGDSFAILAEVYYGSQRYTKFLIKANPQIDDPRSLGVGSVIEIPSLPDLHRTASSVVRSGDAAEPLAKAGTYIVEKGDSFYGIAARLLGAGTRWPEIFELNKDLVNGDPKRLRPGLILKLPKK